MHAKFGVQPTQIADFLGLAGDSVDNIPGVKGVGAKTAVALLAAFGSLDALYADLQRVAELDLRGASKLAAKLARPTTGPPMITKSRSRYTGSSNAW